jgi:hypothetical protein
MPTFHPFPGPDLGMAFGEEPEIRREAGAMKLPHFGHHVLHPARNGQET